MNKQDAQKLLDSLVVDPHKLHVTQVVDVSNEAIVFNQSHSIPNQGYAHCEIVNTSEKTKEFLLLVIELDAD